MTPLLRYTLARMSMFATALALGAVAGLRGVWLWVTAILVSGVASWLLLGQLRDQVGLRVEKRLAAINERIDANTRKEDVD